MCSVDAAPRDHEGAEENEWQGFYFEHRGVEILNSAFTPNPTPPKSKYGNAPFDYSLGYVWDLKATPITKWFPNQLCTKGGLPGAPLNDQAAMIQCIGEQGLGFLIVGGRAVMDEDGDYYLWHRAFKGKEPTPSNTGRSTMRKAAFEPLYIEAFWFANLAALNAARVAGQITDFKQGRQASGEYRNLKFQLHAPKARAGGLAVARFNWPHG